MPVKTEEDEVWTWSLHWTAEAGERAGNWHISKNGIEQVMQESI